MYLTHEIIDAIRAAMGDDFGSQQLFARKVGTSCANVSRWLNGKNRRITQETWRKLQPHIADFMSSGTDGSGAEPAGGDSDGVTIRVSGISCERIVAAVKSADYLSDGQKRDLIARIFYDFAAPLSSIGGSTGCVDIIIKRRR